MGKNNVELIDSVGLDDPAGRDLIALVYAKNADAILYLTSRAQAVSVGELETLDLLKAQGCENLFFIATRADAIRGDEEEREHKKRFERLMAGRTELGKAGIFYVDSRAALRGREKGDERAVAESGILEIEAGRREDGDDDDRRRERGRGYLAGFDRRDYRRSDSSVSNGKRRRR